jgi:hypothetical protein
MGRTSRDQLCHERFFRTIKDRFNYWNQTKLIQLRIVVLGVYQRALLIKRIIPVNRTSLVPRIQITRA